jgi:predicted RNA-binding Zn-ribbon protein involved in translation (DUF1610 family)
MKIGARCTVCGTRIDRGEIRHCETCGRGVHEPCEEYETAFECRHCGDETWVGAVEF